MAQESGQTEEINEQLSQLSTLLADNEELQRVFTNPVYDLAQRKGVLQALSDKLEWTTHLKNFLSLLAEKGRTALIGPIQSAFSALADAQNKRVQVSVTSASKLSNEYIKLLKARLENKTGQEILLHVETDASLMGGVVMHMGDKMLDAALSSRLSEMKERMILELQQS